MSYRFVYPNGGVPIMSSAYDNRRSYSSESFSSESEDSEDYKYQGRMTTHETRPLRDIVRAPTPPPIFKRIVERALTPEPPVLERILIRPQAQEFIERIIEQPRTPPPIVRTRVMKVDRPIQCGFSQPGSPNNTYHTQSIVGSVGRPAGFHDDNSSFSSTSSFEYVPPSPMMMMPASQQQMMYQRVPMQSSYLPQTYMYPLFQHGMSFGYRPMIQQTGMVPYGMPMRMMAARNIFATPPNNFLHPYSLFNPMVQQLVY